MKSRVQLTPKHRHLVRRLQYKAPANKGYDDDDDAVKRAVEQNANITLGT